MEQSDSHGVAGVGRQVESIPQQIVGREVQGDYRVDVVGGVGAGRGADTHHQRRTDLHPETQVLSTRGGNGDWLGEHIAVELVRAHDIDAVQVDAVFIVATGG